MFCLSDYFEIEHFTVESEVATDPQVEFLEARPFDIVPAAK
jgi:hypothetical protein